MRELMSEFKDLRLHGMAGAWEELSANGGSRVEASRWLIEHLLQAEQTDRVMRSIGYQMHAARFPVHRDLAGFDFDQSKVNQKLIRQLADLSFTEEAQNVVFIGGTGTGKTHLATASPITASGSASSPPWTWSMPLSRRRPPAKPDGLPWGCCAWIW